MLITISGYLAGHSRIKPVELRNGPFLRTYDYHSAALAKDLEGLLGSQNMFHLRILDSFICTLAADTWVVIGDNLPGVTMVFPIHLDPNIVSQAARGEGI